MEKRRSFLLTLLPALISALALGSCGHDDDPAPPPEPAPEPAPAPAPPPPPPPPPAPAPAPQAKTCEALNGMQVAVGSIGLPTTGAIVTRTQVVESSGFGPTAVGEFCEVLGEINPVDP